MHLTSEHIHALKTLVREAGELVMSYYIDNDMNVAVKDDASPVTIADQAADRLCTDRLHSLFPEIPVISEEGTNRDIIDEFPFWLVDPLDGTKSFIKRTGAFTVNIGLIVNNAPKYGFVLVPEQNVLYWTDEACGAWRQVGTSEAERIHVRTPPADGVTVVASQSHLDDATKAYIDGLANVSEFISTSSSLKFCKVAEGAADIYPRFGPTMEWDTAAAHAVLLGAGGRLTQPDGSPFIYGKVDQERPFLNGAFVAKGL